ncbi:hypothetical protein KIPB_003142 [Kipferlia bialata]|uniref:Uncharacterized protein n=1 Tax=Kipferlia bialata TaxID=797122 RepID=A0A9K3CSG9_9EUKA|nr:hypothetical protein KIPB_003142 [Kipferlia bialata]|eukprot:g3142.t1
MTWDKAQAQAGIEVFDFNPEELDDSSSSEEESGHVDRVETQVLEAEVEAPELCQAALDDAGGVRALVSILDRFHSVCVSVAVFSILLDHSIAIAAPASNARVLRDPLFHVLSAIGVPRLTYVLAAVSPATFVDVIVSKMFAFPDMSVYVHKLDRGVTISILNTFRTALACSGIRDLDPALIPVVTKALGTDQTRIQPAFDMLMTCIKAGGTLQDQGTRALLWALKELYGRQKPGTGAALKCMSELSRSTDVELQRVFALVARHLHAALKARVGPGVQKMKPSAGILPFGACTACNPLLLLGPVQGALLARLTAALNTTLSHSVSGTAGHDTECILQTAALLSEWVYVSTEPLTDPSSLSCEGVPALDQYLDTSLSGQYMAGMDTYTNVNV